MIYQRRAELESVTAQLNQRIMDKRMELERLNGAIAQRRVELDRPVVEFDGLIGEQQERYDELITAKTAELDRITRLLRDKQEQLDRQDDAELDALERDLGARVSDMEARKASVLQLRYACSLAVSLGIMWWQSGSSVLVCGGAYAHEPYSRKRLWWVHNL